MSKGYAVASGVICFLLLIGLLILAVGCAPQSAGPGAPGKEPYTLSGPYVHDNLTLFLMHVREVKDKTDYLTLSEGLVQKNVVVSEMSEGGDVNTLQIQNNSDKPLYVQSGDFIRGGKQDRSIAVDFVLPPHSAQTSIAAFCVEPHRWSKEGEDISLSSGTFNFESTPASGKLKLAIKEGATDQGVQGEVWDQVAKSREKLAENLPAAEYSEPLGGSGGSMAKTVDSKPVQEATEKYINALKGILEGKPDVAGVVVIVNGQIQSADLYPNPALFRKLWEPTLKSASVAALAEKNKAPEAKPVSKEDVVTFLSAPESGQEESRPLGGDISMKRRKAEKTVRYDTENNGKPVHNSWAATD